MKRRLLLLFLFLPVTAPADELRLSDVVATARRAIEGPRAGFEDNPLDHLKARAMMAATGADLALTHPSPYGTRLPTGLIKVSDVFAWIPRDEPLAVMTLRGRQIRAALERTAARFAPYDAADDRPLLLPGVADSALDAIAGIAYEIDLSAPEGQRVLNLSFRGQPLDDDAELKVVTTASRRAAGDLEGMADTAAGGWLQDAVLKRLRSVGAPDGDFVPDWTVLPDYAPLPERPLIDRLVRMGGAPRGEVERLFPDQPARRGDAAYWLARAFGWREERHSGAFPDLPDSLEAWVDGLLRRRVFDVTTNTSELFRPFAPATIPLMRDWCEGAARAAGLPLKTVADRRRFRLALLSGTSLPPDSANVVTDRLTRGQMLGMIANARLAIPEPPRRSRR